MQVYKFGGTSVGSPERMKNIARLLEGRKDLIVVLSAMSGTTDRLEKTTRLLFDGNKKEAAEEFDRMREVYLELLPGLFADMKIVTEAREIIKSHFDYLRSLTLKEFSRNDEKAILAQGELMSTALFFLLCKEMGLNTSLLPALSFMRTDKDGEPDMFYIRENLGRELKEHTGKDIIITQGYICRNVFGELDNLKRGGSDYTATIIGACLEVSEIQIWTDISGLHNNDPRFVRNTKVIRELSFDEAAELSYFGARILHPTSLVPARSKGIAVRLKNSLQPEDEGTIISNKSKGSGYKAVAAKDGITAIKVKSDRMLMAYGFLRKIFEIFENYRTPIDMITTSEVAVSLTIDDDARLESIVSDLRELGHVEVEENQAIICVVGDFIAEKSGTTIELFTALQGIPLRMISYGGSRHNISLLTESRYKKEALNALNHHLFNMSRDV
ncbi:MAG: aspartate kinase [Bacteroidota bacterium]